MNTLINISVGLLRIGLGIFFLIIGILKASKIDELQKDIEHFYVFPVSLAYPLACLGIAMELILAFCLLTKKYYQAGCLLGIGLSSSFILLFAQGWIRGLSLSCNCLGVHREITSYPFEIGWRILLLCAMCILFYLSSEHNQPNKAQKRLDFSQV